MKDTLIRIIYIILIILGLYLLWAGHVGKRMNQIILGLGLILLALFIMHYPISFIPDNGADLRIGFKHD